MTAPTIVGVVATYQRPMELARLLGSLEQVAGGLRGVVVVDNADQPETRDVTERSVLQTCRLTPGKNLGCGGGLCLGEKTAFEVFPDLTHLWILDDDTVIGPSSLQRLLEAMDESQADAAHPLVVAPDGSLGWFPGLLDAKKFRAIRRRQTPDEFIARCGSAPIPFSWSQGIALLVTRRVFTELGYHREDYWVRGEDLEFSLRITYHFRGIYVPHSRVEHLPPAPPKANAGALEYVKHRAMLQNVAFTALHLPHGRRLIRTIPGNWLRFLRTWQWRPRTLIDAADVFIAGGLLGLPAGARQPAEDAPATRDFADRCR